MICKKFYFFLKKKKQRRSSNILLHWLTTHMIWYDMMRRDEVKGFPVGVEGSHICSGFLVFTQEPCTVVHLSVLRGFNIYWVIGKTKTKKTHIPVRLIIILHSKFYWIACVFRCRFRISISCTAEVKWLLCFTFFRSKLTVSPPTVSLRECWGYVRLTQSLLQRKEIFWY